MIPFVIIINFLEVFLFSSFIAFFFDLKNKIRYITVIGTINFIITNLSSFYSYDGSLLTISVIFFTILGLIIETREITFKTLFIPIIYNLLIIVCSTISIWLMTFVLSIQPSNLFENQLFFYTACILSKFLQFVVSLFFYSIVKKITISLKLKEWWMVIITELSILISIVLCLYSLNFEKVDLNIIKVILFLLILANILFYAVILISNQNYNEKLQHERKIREYDFNKQKYDTIKHLKKETDALNHRMYYVLWQIEWLVENNDLNQIKSCVNKYKYILNKNQYVIDSGNAVFDCLLSLKFSKCIDNGTNLKVSIAIQKNNFYDDLDFINSMNGLIDRILIESKYIDFKMMEINMFLLIRFDIVVNHNGCKNIDEIVNSLTTKYHGKYNIDLNENNCTIKISLPLIRYNVTWI